MSWLRRKNLRLNFGFTFIELLVVVSIVSLLSVVGVANYRTFSAKRTVRNVAEELKSCLVLAQKSAQAGKKFCSGTFTGVKVDKSVDGWKIYSTCEGDEVEFSQSSPCKFSDPSVTISGNTPVNFDIKGIPGAVFTANVQNDSTIWQVLVDTSGMIVVSQ